MPPLHHHHLLVVRVDPPQQPRVLARRRLPSSKPRKPQQLLEVNRSCKMLAVVGTGWEALQAWT